MLEITLACPLGARHFLPWHRPGTTKGSTYPNYRRAANISTVSPAQTITGSFTTAGILNNSFEIPPRNAMQPTSRTAES